MTRLVLDGVFVCHIGTGILKTVMPDSGRKRETPPEMVPDDRLHTNSEPSGESD